jgi:hypothetical protein
LAVYEVATLSDHVVNKMKWIQLRKYLFPFDTYRCDRISVFRDANYG